MPLNYNYYKTNASYFKQTAHPQWISFYWQVKLDFDHSPLTSLSPCFGNLSLSTLLENS